MAEAAAHKFVEKSQIAPTTTKIISLPLTFLDLSFAGPVYVRRQFFYQFSHPINVFYETTLPSLKHTLSLTLQHFFPLAGNLLCPPPPHKPFIRCTHDDTVTLTIIESKADFNHLSSHHPKSLKDLRHLVPKLTCKNTPVDDDDDDTFIFPLVAFQVTVFPSHGLCIAITYCHVMDDSCCSHFMKSWSSICRSGGVDFSLVENSPPCFDRKVLKDPKGLEEIFLRDYFEERSTWKDKLFGKTPKHVCQDENYVKATITFSRDDIEKLKKWVLNEWENNDKFKPPQYVSKFVVTCAFVWSSLVKAKYRNNDDDDDQEEEYFRFAADCRDRFEYPIPATYFGNCLTKCYAVLKRKELKGEGGFVKAVKGIAMAITDLKTEPLKGAENWRALFKKMFVLGSTVLVTGSPKFSVYETDFGFGKPIKVEMVHSLKRMSLAESGEGEGGLELGLVFRSEEYEYFISVIQQRFVTLKS